MAARVIPVTSPKSDTDEQNIQLPCRCDAPLKARSDEPCPVHQDVTFDAESIIKAAGGAPRLDAIAFRNHYVASISIQQRQARPEGLVWVAVLRDMQLAIHAFIPPFMAPFPAALMQPAKREQGILIGQQPLH